MNQELLIAFISGLGGMLGWGFADFFAKKTIDEVGDITSLFWGQFIGVFALLGLFLLHPVLPSFNYQDLIIVLILGIGSALSYIPAYVAFGKGKVSLLSPIFASYALWVVLFSAIFFKEVIPVNRIAAFLVVFLGMILITGDPRSLFVLITGTKKSTDTKGLKEILFATLLYSGWLIAFDFFINGKNWVPYLLIIRAISSLTLFIYARRSKRVLTIKNNSIWKFLILIGLFDVLAYSFVAYGFSSTSYISVIAMLSGAFSLPTIILARTFLKEKLTAVQTTGSLVIILGIVILSIN